jgi:hypothetical protein
LFGAVAVLVGDDAVLLSLGAGSGEGDFANEVSVVIANRTEDSEETNRAIIRDRSSDGRNPETEDILVVKTFRDEGSETNAAKLRRNDLGRVHEDREWRAANRIRLSGSRGSGVLAVNGITNDRCAGVRTQTEAVLADAEIDGVFATRIRVATSLAFGEVAVGGSVVIARARTSSADVVGTIPVAAKISIAVDEIGVAATALLEDALGADHFAFTVASSSKSLGAADVVDTSGRSSVVGNDACRLVSAVVEAERSASLDTRSASSVHTTFRSTIALIRRVTSARVVGGGNTANPFESSGADHARLDVGVHVATIFANVAVNWGRGVLIIPVTVDSDAENSFLSESSRLHDNRVGVPGSKSTIELSTTVEGVATAPERETVAAVQLTFRTFSPAPSILHALSTNPAIDAELCSKERVFVSGCDCGEVTLNAKVVVVETVTFSDEVGLVGFVELVNVAGSRVVHRIGASSPTDTADIEALRGREERNLAEDKSVVLDGEGTFDSQNTELRVEDVADAREGNVALEVVHTLGIAAVNGNSKTIEDGNTRTNVDDSGVERILGSRVTRSIGDIGVITSVPLATSVLETFGDVGLVEALRSGDRASNAAAIDPVATKRSVASAESADTGDVVSELFADRIRSDHTLVALPDAVGHVDATKRT